MPGFRPCSAMQRRSTDALPSAASGPVKATSMIQMRLRKPQHSAAQRISPSASVQRLRRPCKSADSPPWRSTRWFRP